MKIFVSCLMLLAICFFGLGAYGASKAERGAKSSQGKLRGTMADASVQEEVMKLILESKTLGSCKEVRFIKAKISKPLNAGLWTEEWAMNICGRKAKYFVGFMLGEKKEIAGFIFRITTKGAVVM